jgi:uncharacterized membrane protein
MRLWLITYLVTAIGFLGCDAVWLSIMASRLYRPALGGMLRESFAPAPAIAFYVIYIAGILIFAVAPARAAGVWYGATWRGALLGLIAYATYDLTNQATLRDWPLAITLADLCWGTMLTALTATIGFIAARWLGGSASTG